MDRLFRDASREWNQVDLPDQPRKRNSQLSLMVVMLVRICAYGIELKLTLLCCCECCDHLSIL